MGQARRSSKSFRRLFIGGFCGLSLAAACGGNPELSQNRDTGTVGGDADIGQHCDDETHCKDGLHCGDGDVCVGACGALTSTSCGDEACLPDGSCSQGLGNTCDSSDDCKKGLVCSDLKHCAVPCTPGEAKVCKKNAACSDSGTCPTDNDIVITPPDNGTGGDSGAGGAPGCIDLKVDFTPQIPTVLLLIDRSGSMTNESKFGDAVKAAVTDGSYMLGDCPLVASPTKDDPDRMVDTNDWRWNVVRDVLMSPSKGIVKPLEDRVRFGLSLYSGRNGQIKDPVKQDDPIEIDPTKMCPELIEVPIALGNHQAMLEQFKCSDISDDTPTGESLVAAAATLAAFKEPGPKVIVLATDGEPDNCECPDPGGHVPAKCKDPGMPAQIKADVVATAAKIHEDDVTIHVINVSTPGEAALQKHLEDVASAGGGMVYPGFSPGALTDAFDAIIDGARSCTIDLDGEIAKGKESSGKVTLDGEELALDGKNGWRANSSSQIELLGKACKLIKSGQHDLAITFPCGSFKPPVH